MPSAAEIRKTMEEYYKAMAVQLAQAEEDERREVEARRVAEEEQVAAEEARRENERKCRERQAILDEEEEAERRAAEKAERRARRKAEKRRKEEATMGMVARGSQTKMVMEESEDVEMGADEACWNCRSRSIPCKRTR